VTNVSTCFISLCSTSDPIFTRRVVECVYNGTCPQRRMYRVLLSSYSYSVIYAKSVFVKIGGGGGGSGVLSVA